MEPFIEDMGISYDQYFYLHLIKDNPGCNQNFLVSIFDAKKSLISTTLRDLEDKNLITQVIDPDNRRSYIINLTDKGEEIIDYLIAKDKKGEELIYNYTSLPDKDLQNSITEVYELFSKAMKE